MKIAISLIKVDAEERIRKDMGDLEPLVDSIEKVGLINPIVIDENSNLVAGFRRLEACRRLGWEEIEVKIVNVDGNQMTLLDVELAENFYRKDFTSEEILAGEKRRAEILEASREKGLFERFSLWLKRLFAPAPGKEPRNNASPRQATATSGEAATAEAPRGEKAAQKNEPEETRPEKEEDLLKEEKAAEALRPRQQVSQSGGGSTEQRPIQWRTK